ncbi:MAG TPA: protein-disulfide reductase DsbD domain-containing protein [Planctomycetota bacterium]|nr:protein-disulfide reductase DsbD domain-containing protein [Planctomycetota bacterium]
MLPAPNHKLVALMLGLLARAAAAQDGSVHDGQAASSAPLRARLVAESRELVAGRTNPVGVLLELADGWHTYAPFLNDSGLPLTLQPELPAGFVVRAAEWPAPQRLSAEGGLLDHVYAGHVLLPLPLDVPASAAGSTVTLRVHVGWMVCRSACQRGEADVSLELPVAAAGASPPFSDDAPAFAEARARTPQPLPPQSAPLAAALESGALVLSAPGAAWLAFYPDADAPAFADIGRDGARDGERLALPLGDVASPEAAVRGVAEVRWADGRAPSFFRLEVSVPSAPGRAVRAPTPQENPHVR